MRAAYAGCQRHKHFGMSSAKQTLSAELEKAGYLNVRGPAYPNSVKLVLDR